MFKRKSKPKQTDSDFLKYYYKQTTIEQRDTIDKQDEIIRRQNEALKRILQLTEANAYGNERAFLDKIKELAKTAIQD